jgi:ribokinase
MPVTDAKSAEEAAKILFGRGIKTVIVTLGSQGSLLLADGKATHVPSKKIKAEDTTAAGDAFNGGLAFALAEGMSLEEALPFSNHVGALSATKMGAQPSMPTRSEVLEFGKS